MVPEGALESSGELVTEFKVAWNGVLINKGIRESKGQTRGVEVG